MYFNLPKPKARKKLNTQPIVDLMDESISKLQTLIKQKQ